MTRSRRNLVLLVCVIGLASGCAGSQKRFWTPARFASPLMADVDLASTHSDPHHEAERSYAKAVELEDLNESECVDWYLMTAELLWPSIATQDASTSSNDDRAVHVYRSAVGRFIQTAQRYGRLDPTSGVRVSSQPASDEGTVQLASFESDVEIPVRMYGFAWDAENFERISVVGEYQTPDVIHPHRQAGIGVPLLVQHATARQFVHPEAVFNATAILRPRKDSDGDSATGFVLDIVNPLLIRETLVDGSPQPVALDLTAHVAYLSVNQDRKWLKGFLHPEEVEAGLKMIEPYQPGKVPVIFVHGLASDPMTWAAMANELFVYPEILEHFQFWVFSYPTGTAFPTEAAKLRQQLVDIRKHIDPNREDVALDRMVLIGHSMGGLISKLQVTDSGNQLSNAILKVPFEELEMNAQLKQKFSDFLFFESSDQVNRVIFIGTPHRGSLLADAAGGIVSRLVHRSGAVAEQCTQFIQLNSDAFITPLERLPTSVDMLKPKNPLLEAIFTLPVDAHVRMHSIIGTGHKAAFGKKTERSDGVVPVSSAKHPGVETELFVDADHGLHHHPETIGEVVRILRLHAGIQAEQQTSHAIAAH